MLNEKDRSAPEVKHIKVSCDGSWTKHGFTKKCGFASVTEIITGMLMDIV